MPKGQDPGLGTLRTPNPEPRHPSPRPHPGAVLSAPRKVLRFRSHSLGRIYLKTSTKNSCELPCRLLRMSVTGQKSRVRFLVPELPKAPAVAGALGQGSPSRMLKMLLAEGSTKAGLLGQRLGHGSLGLVPPLARLRHSGLSHSPIGSPGCSASFFPPLKAEAPRTT